MDSETDVLIYLTHTHAVYLKNKSLKVLLHQVIKENTYEL